MDLKLISKTKTFKILLLIFIIWGVGFIIFLTIINPNDSKIPGDPENFARDFIWLFYWRWNLDYLMITAWFLIILVESWAYRKLARKIKKETLSIWISPIFNMAFVYLYMLAIDIGVTYFADTGFDANWNTTDILFFGFTAQQLYHNFFFWMIPIVIFCTALNQVMIYQNSYAKVFKTWFIMMAVYSLILGFLDPVVCHILWGDWRIFGNWAMGGADPIWAEGWITHYVIFALLWLLGAKLVYRVRDEIIDIKLGQH